MIKKQGLLARFLLSLLVFCWPILYLSRYIFPIGGDYTSIGNDFVALYYKYKLYLLACLSDFQFPLWSPAGGAGYPFRDNPFAQALYPFNLVLAVWYKISEGYNPLDHQVFTVLGISIFALGLFKWLRLLNSNLRAVLFSVLIMSVSFKVTEMLRFPNAVHTAAWYPWILYALTKVMFSDSLKKSIFGGVQLVLFLVCLCTGGYPYYLYYSIFLFVPYVFIFPIKSLRTRLFGDRAFYFKRAMITLLMVGLIVMLFCGPYLLRSKRLLAETAERPAGDFAYSTKHIFNYQDTIGSLVYPPFAAVEGWYFFSITGFLIVLLYLLVGKSSGKAEEANGLCSRCFRVKWLLVVWIGLISYITYGGSSYLFIFLWKYMPGFCSLRVWGRLNIVLVPILAWLLSLAYESFESAISGQDVLVAGKRSQRLSPIITVSVVYLIVLGTQLYLYLDKLSDGMWANCSDVVLSKDVNFIIYGLISFVILLFFLILSRRVQLKSDRSLSVVLGILVLMGTIEMYGVGSRIWTREYEKLDMRLRIDVAKVNKRSFAVKRTEFDNTISLSSNFSVGVIPNWYFNRYIKFLDKTKNEIKSRRVLLGVYDGTKIFFSESLAHSTIKSFLSDAVRYRRVWRVMSYTGDELVCHADVPVAGYLSFVDNWDPNWKVFVDGESADIELLFGTFKSVKLNAGRHKVRFVYQPGRLAKFKK